MESLDTKCPLPSHVNVANFVTMTGFDYDDDCGSFRIWQKQMMCLLKSQDMEGFVTGETPCPEKDETGAWSKRDMLVQGWILGSIGEDALKGVWEKKTAKNMWDTLEDRFGSGNNIYLAANESPDESYRNIKLYKAAQTGKWDNATKDLFGGHFEATLSRLSETALHVAVMSDKRTPFVMEVVKLMPRETLAHQDAYGDTALHCAAAAGNFEAVKTLIEQNPDLPYIPNKVKELPVLKAAIAGKQKPLEFLISASKDSNRDVKPFEGRLGLNLLCEVIISEMFDVALKLVEDYPRLAGLRSDDDEEEDGTCNADIRCALLTMAERPSAFRSGENFNWYQSFIYHCLLPKRSKHKVDLENGFFRDVEKGIDNSPSRNNDYCRSWFQRVPQVENMAKRIQVHERASKLVEKLCHGMIKLSEKNVRCMFLDTILLAAENGISEIVEKIIKEYPSVVFAVDHKGRHVFQLAAKNRYENVFNIIYRLGDLKSELFDVPDDKGNNLMHICGKLAPTHRLNLVPGAALQMQLELQWFKEMEKFVHPSRRTQKNKNDQTPQMVFTEAYPSVVFATDHKGRHVFQLAAKNRYENVFNIIYSLNDLKSELFDIPDYKDNNLMHMCGKLAPTHRLNLVPGAALQMQRELQWFKEMEKFVHPSRRTQKNNNGQTPQMVFTEKHKHLKKSGEKWMKETATACNIAATLIATVMFSAVFQLPDREFSKFAFDFFGVSDAISLFTSITSMFMFLSILTSRYAEEDFAHSLPWRLSLGLLTLFISIISMLAAFSATLYIIFRPEKIAWILILMAVFACLPVTLFVLLQFPLLMEVLRSTYGRRIFGNFSK